ncbi:MAG: UvrD-helicase domain-containing protein, partial [Deltaproteobacteria bacterium]|nr:UvrD-helicase domain-containing protein [Deltaproteobacteria bacterium]
APGTLLVEASAGTGKTHGITDLVLRLVVEKEIPIDRILVVTFTRAATAELRGRVRRRLTQARDLAIALAQGDGEPDKDTWLSATADPVLRLLTSHERRGLAPAPRDELAPVARLLGMAVRDFDAAPIATIHSFCQEVLRARPVETGVPIDGELIEDSAELTSEIVDDFLACTLWNTSDKECRLLQHGCDVTRSSLQELAAKVTAQPDATVEPRIEEWRELLRQWWQEAADLCARWSGPEGDGLIAALDAACSGKPKAPVRLDGRSYQTGRSRDYRQMVADFLTMPTDPKSLLPKKGKRDSWVRYFTACQVAGACKTGSIEHSLLQKWQSLVELADRLVDAPRAAFAHHARTELQARLAARAELTFQDLLRRVRDALRAAAPQAESLRRALRERYRAALVDEFQDTDDVQWPIFEALFHGSPEHYLFLIGDPKQAIYRFRGADITVYVRAKKSAPGGRTMTVNYRSDRSYVDALGRLFGSPPDAFEDEAVSYVPVTTPDRTPADRLTLPPGRARIELRWIGPRREEPAVVLTKGQANRLLPGQVAKEVLALLDSGARMEDGAKRPLHAGDIAVLVRTNRQAAAVHAALRRAAVPAIVAQAGSVMDSDEARLVETWLDAVASPDRETPARRLAVTTFAGWTAPQLQAAIRAANEPAPAAGRDPAGPDGFSALRRRIRRWAQEMPSRGFHATLRAALERHGTLLRLAALPDGERRITNLRHVIELAEEAAVRDRLDAAGLARWLHARRHRGDTEAEVAELRLESDALAVKVATLHKSKGLQYRVVLLPYLWDGALLQAKDKQVLLFHEGEKADGALRIDLRTDCESEPKRSHLESAKIEAFRENVRLLYVGLTRAQHHAVLWWGPINEANASPLGSVLHGASEAGEHEGHSRSQVARARLQQAFYPKKPDLGVMYDDLDRLSRPGADGRRLIRWSPTPPEEDAPSKSAPAPTQPEAEKLAAATFTRACLDTTWRRMSYTSLSGKLHAGQEHAVAAALPGVPDDPDGKDHDVEAAADEVAGEPLSGGEVAGVAAPEEVPLAALHSGTSTGSWVHGVLELLDFETCTEKEGARRSLPALVADTGRRLGIADEAQHAMLVDGLPRILATPLGLPQHPELRLQDIAPGDRLDELGFDMPVAGGARWSGGATVEGAALVQALRQRAEGALPAEFLDRLGGLDELALAGLLTGSIDLAFRVGSGPDQMWYVCDYKTNRLTAPRQSGQRGRLPSTPACYAEQHMRAEMDRHAYFLQYHLYLVALHRMLGRRLAGYDYDRHMGGAAYLFLRGMTGPAVARDGQGRPHGVFFHRPEPEAIAALGAALDVAGSVRS